MIGRSLLEKTWLDGACWFAVGGSQKKNALPLSPCLASRISAEGPGGNARSARQPTIPTRTRDRKAIRFIGQLPVGAWYNPQLGANLGRLRRPARLRFSRLQSKKGAEMATRQEVGYVCSKWINCRTCATVAATLPLQCSFA